MTDMSGVGFRNPSLINRERGERIIMNISDIIQLVIFCALIFFPLGYYARHSIPYS
jgi:hypothetical protein